MNAEPWDISTIRAALEAVLLDIHGGELRYTTASKAHVALSALDRLAARLEAADERYEALFKTTRDAVRLGGAARAERDAMEQRMDGAYFELSSMWNQVARAEKAEAELGAAREALREADRALLDAIIILDLDQAGRQVTQHAREVRDRIIAVLVGGDNAVKDSCIMQDEPQSQTER